ncbi:MAG: translation initiation factor 2 [Desulfovibrio sp.]|jgi:hypothetical protein|nr:translation initiation factor 2 [Desulfovibrio sp.]
MRTLFFLCFLMVPLVSTVCAASGEKSAAAETKDAIETNDKKAKTGKAGKGAPSSRGGKGEEQIRSELDEVARKLTAQAARTLRPSKDAKEIRKDGDEYVAFYVEVDTDNVTAEMRPASTPGMYVGIVGYAEKIFECRGNDKKAALAAPCREIKKGGRSEMILFNGKIWQY